jgi:Dolichyl-phosphate-mannose-protein mannosyltransferase
VRFRLLDVPLERDEGEYAYAGQLILQGIPPYRLAYNMKLPGTYAAYAAILALFGETPRGIHLGLLLVNLATAVLLFLLVRRLFDDVTAAAAGGAFAVLSMGRGVLGLFAHATHFVLLPALAGILLLQRAIDSRRPTALIASGACLGTAFVMKQHGLAFVLFGLAWLLWDRASRRERVSIVARSCAWLLLGCALPFALTCLALAGAGVFKEFWFWTFSYARFYVTEVPPSIGLRILAQMIPGVAAPAWPLWALAGAGLMAPLWDEAARARWRFTTLFLLVSILSICPGFYFREHYFVLLLPALALLAAIGAAASARALARASFPERPEGRDRLAACVLLPVFSGALLYPVFHERALFFAMSPERFSRACYGANPFPEAVVLASRIAGDTGPEDRIGILGSEPEICFYARRRSATGYIYMYGLMEDQPYARRMQQEAIREIEAQAPRYLVFVNVPQSWLGRPGSDTSILTWSRSYLAEHYRMEGVADIQSDDETVYVWGEQALSYTPRSSYVVYLFKRLT